MDERVKRNTLGQLKFIDNKYYGEIMERFHKFKKIESKISLLKNTLSDFLSYEKYIENNTFHSIRIYLPKLYAGWEK